MSFLGVSKIRCHSWMWSKVRECERDWWAIDVKQCGREQIACGSNVSLGSEATFSRR
jgi:hypothetical protein